MEQQVNVIQFCGGVIVITITFAICLSIFIGAAEFASNKIFDNKNKRK